MITYGWANPRTQIREQAATLQEACYVAWNELQEPNLPAGVDTVSIFEQIAAGEVGRASGNIADEMPEEWSEDGPGYSWSWASPADATRWTAPKLSLALETIRIQFNSLDTTGKQTESNATATVILYQQRFALFVQQDQPRPAKPTPPEKTPSQEILDAIASHQQGMTGDSQATAQALLFIALDIRGHHAAPAQGAQPRPAREVQGQFGIDVDNLKKLAESLNLDVKISREQGVFSRLARWITEKWNWLITAPADVPVFRDQYPIKLSKPAFEIPAGEFFELSAAAPFENTYVYRLTPGIAQTSTGPRWLKKFHGPVLLHDIQQLGTGEYILYMTYNNSSIKAPRAKTRVTVTAAETHPTPSRPTTPAETDAIAEMIRNRSQFVKTSDAPHSFIPLFGPYEPENKRPCILCGQPFDGPLHSDPTPPQEAA